MSRRLTVGCDFVHRSSFDVAAVFQVEPVADQQADLVEAAVVDGARRPDPDRTPTSTATRAAG